MAKNDKTIEPAPEYTGTYRCKDFGGVAVRVRGWQLEPMSEAGVERWLRESMPEGHDTDEDGDPIWHAPEGDDWPWERTGRVIVVMVGDDDDARHAVDPGDLTPLRGSEYCQECGQIGCSHVTVDDDDAYAA